MKTRECDYCGRDVEVRDNLSDNIAVFCSTKCRYAKKKLVVYTSEGCFKCSMLTSWLRVREFAFEEKTLDTEATADLIMKNVVVMSAPVLEVEGTFYTEDQLFDGTKILADQLLEILEG